MANGIKRVSNIFRNALDLDAAEVKSFRKAVIAAAESADPVSKGELRRSISEFQDVDTYVFNNSPAGAFLQELADRVVELMEDTKLLVDVSNVSGDDIDDEETAAAEAAAEAAETARVKKLLKAARAENLRDERGFDLRGCGDTPQLVWNRARKIARRVDDGLMTEAQALAKLKRRDLETDELRQALGSFLAAYEVACEEFSDLKAKRRRAVRRAAEHSMVGEINLHDNIRRARISGRDPTVAADQITERLIEALIRVIGEANSAGKLRRPVGGDA
jgi:hypothetical protein